MPISSRAAPDPARPPSFVCGDSPLAIPLITNGERARVDRDNAPNGLDLFDTRLLKLSTPAVALTPEESKAGRKIIPWLYDDILRVAAKFRGFQSAGPKTTTEQL